MEVLLAGTGAADGWPNPFCGCASCRGAAALGQVRGQTAALVDGTLLLDCGPEVPRAVARAGHDLTRVRHLLLTHAHPDHIGPLALLMRSWAGRTEGLDVVGPEAALELCQPWVGPHDPVHWRPVTAGESLQVGRYAVRALEASHDGPGLLYDVEDDAGACLLYATDTGPLPTATLQAVRDRAYHLVLLEETFGDAVDHGTDHLDLRTFPAALGALRGFGAIGPRTDVVAVHLGHRNPAPDELSRRLAGYGARIVPDGTLLTLGEPRPLAPAPPTPHRTLVLGGARSGKSMQAERLLAAETDVVYVATGGTRPGDPEWAARVAVHRARRPPTWTTEETTDLEGLLSRPGPPLLVDCLTLWLSAAMDRAGVWDVDPDEAGSVRHVEAAVKRLRTRVDLLLAAWRGTNRRVVAVTNEVGSGVVPATFSGRLFRDELGRLNALVAAECETVVAVTAGVAQVLREVTDRDPGAAG